MGFLKNYLDKHRLEVMPDKHQKNLDNLEKKLEEKAKGKKSFEDALKDYGPEIAGLVERASNAFSNISFSFQKFRVVIGIGVEVYQLVDKMSDSILSDSMTVVEKESAKLDFGKDLTYFIWMTIDPLKGYFKWVPFKKSIEKLIVKWLAGYALETAADLLKSRGVTVFTESAITVRALP